MVATPAVHWHVFIDPPKDLNPLPLDEGAVRHCNMRFVVKGCFQALRINWTRRAAPNPQAYGFHGLALTQEKNRWCCASFRGL